MSSYVKIPSCTCGALKEFSKRQHEERVIQFLLGLNVTSGQIRGQILLMNPLPSLNKAYTLVLQEEKQRTIVHPLNTTDSSAMMANKSNWHHKTQNQYGDKSKFQNQSKNVTRQNKNCTHCEGTGHTVDRCFSIIGFPLGHKLHKVYPSKSAATMTHMIRSPRMVTMVKVENIHHIKRYEA